MGVSQGPKPAQIFRVKKTVTFTGGTGAGTVGVVELFNVTGKVLVLASVGYCSTNLVGDLATIKMGTAEVPALLSSGPTTATDVLAGDIWGSGGRRPLTSGVAVDGYQQTGPYALQDDDIVFTIEDAPVTGGVVTVELVYSEILSGGSVAAA